jgi:hypothetical protein
MHEQVQSQIDVAAKLIAMSEEDGERLSTASLLDYMAILGVQFAVSGPDPDGRGVTLVSAAYIELVTGGTQ